MQDPVEYGDPENFRPERFIRDGKLDSSIRDPYDFIFGFGRRLCPGRHFADASLLAIVSMVLHVFNITPPVDENGEGIKVLPRMDSSFVS